MKQKISYLFFLAILLTGNAYAQKEKPNFSGTWNLDKKESKTYFLGSENSEFTRQLPDCSVEKTIEHNEPELKIRTITKCLEETSMGKSLKTFETNFIYFTDGRGEVNKPDDSDSIESKTKWDGNKILIVNNHINPKNNKKEMSLSKELSISKNKAEMFEKLADNKSGFYSAATAFGSIYTKRVYKLSK